MKKTAALLLVLLTLLGAGYLWTLPSHNEQAVRVDIRPGASLTAMAQRWQDDGWLPSALLLKVQARLLGKQQVLRVGEFDIPPRLTGPQLLAFLAEARPVSYRLSFIEGTTLREAIQTLQQAPRLKQDVTPLTRNQIAEVLGIHGNPEGWLYPDTYIYHSGESVSRILQQAHQRMQDNLQQAWQQRQHKLPYQTPYEALIMASIVEKETGVGYERPKIAGVLVRRLERNMRMETDPTVIYGLGDSFDGNLRKKHLRDRSNRYNTYRHKGLPPSPIAFAGRAAIDAALHPQDGEELYFVAKGDGSHYFSSTLKEHNKAVRKYQINRRKETYRSAPPEN